MNKVQTGLLAIIAAEPGARLLKLLLKILVLPIVGGVLVVSAVSGNSSWLVTPMLILLGFWFLKLRGVGRR
jgi:hypothetical protein